MLVPIVSGIDWGGVLGPSTPLLEIFIRGTLIYLSLFVLLRVILKRQSGDVGLSDFLVVALIADAAQNGMADDYTSVPDGVLLVATILFWSYALDWLGYRFPPLQRFVHPPPLALVRNGRMLRKNMSKELVTEEELMSKLRLEGIHDLSRVKEARMEGDGQISFVKYES